MSNIPPILPTPQKPDNYYICATCHASTPGRKVTPGSLFTEIFLYLCCLLPGLIYTAWRYTARKKVCHLCGNAPLLPTNSPAARAITHR